MNTSACAVLVATILFGVWSAGVASAEPSPGVDYTKCTNQIDYSGDPRTNAEINGIGANTGKCPAPMTAGSSGSSAPSTQSTVPAAGDENDRAFLTKLVRAGIRIPNAQAAEHAIAIAHQGCDLSRSSNDPSAVTQKVVSANSSVDPGIVARVLSTGIMHYCPEVLTGVPLR